MKRRSFVALIAFLFTGAAPVVASASPDVFASIQRETGWKGEHEPRTYDSPNFPGVEPGEAPVLEEYGFTRLERQTFRNQIHSIQVDLYEMVDSTAAYGAFSFFRNTSSSTLQGVGNLAVEQNSRILFMQNRFFVRLSPSSKEAAVGRVLVQMGQIISRELPRVFSMPPIAKRLPKEDLVERSDLFALGFHALNQKFSLGNKDYFGLANGAEAAMAEYRAKGDSAKLLLIQYPTQQLAKKFLERGYSDYIRQNTKDSVFFKRDGPQVVLVFGATSAEIATTLLDRVSYVSSVTWDPKAQPVSVGQMMLNIFLFTGILLAMTLGAGLAFGVIRVILKRLFPGKIFDRPETLEVIRLNLLDRKK